MRAEYLTSGEVSGSRVRLVERVCVGMCSAGGYGIAGLSVEVCSVQCALCRVDDLKCHGSATYMHRSGLRFMEVREERLNGFGC